MIDPRDRRAQGDPETVVLLPNGESLIGLYIRGVPGAHMFGIRLDEVGRPVSVARDEAMFHIEPAIVPAQNPRRYPKAYPIGKDEE